MQGAEPEPPVALIVAGPTASGKSALALDLAERLAGTIVNADSMQVYRELRVLTARPTQAEEARVPHALYGLRSAAEAGSVAWWRAAALDAMEAAREAGRVPILCGGTGLYLAAVAGGIAAIPDPGDAARTEARALLVEIGPAALHARLAERDPHTAGRLRPSDRQRVARAWEVWRGTGRGLAAWQADQATAAPNWTFSAVLLDPPRPALRAAIAARFAAMLEQGALEEVRALRALGLPPSLPAMRAHGVPELSAYLDGKLSLRRPPPARWPRPGGTRSARRPGSGTMSSEPRHDRGRLLRGGTAPRNFQKKTWLICALFFAGDVDARACGSISVRARAEGCEDQVMTADHQQTGAEILLRALAEQGVEVLFGYPGGAVLPIYDAIFQQNAIRHVLVRHEQAAVHAAEGYARSTGKVGVVLVTSGPGATNAVTGLVDALMDSIPVVCLTGQVPTHLIGNDAFQEADTTGITRPATKHNYLVKRPEDLARVVHEAFYVARNGRPGPVVVDLPKDVVICESALMRRPRPPPIAATARRPSPMPGRSQKAMALLKAAKRPVVYTGGGVINAGPTTPRAL